jgi:transcriptional regulator with XRE-family HTH domain
MLHPVARRRLRAARTAAGLSLRDLGARLGVSASLLSQIENGRTDPSVSSLYALVTELGLSLDALLQLPDGDDDRPDDPSRPAAPSAGTPVVRPSQRRVLEIDSGVRWEQLTPGPDARVDALLTTYEPGGSSSSSGRLMTHPGVEYAYLIEGELTLQLGFETRVIAAGDSLVFESSTPHLYRNDGRVRARGTWFILQPDTVSPASAVSPLSVVPPGGSPILPWSHRSARSVIEGLEELRRTERLGPAAPER